MPCHILCMESIISFLPFPTTSMGHLIICLGARIQWTYSIYGVPCLVSTIPRNSLYSLCSVWDLLPAFCGICCLPFVELSLLHVGHTAILLWNLLYSVGPAAYFLWDSLPAFDGNHYLFPQARSPHCHLSGQMSGPTHMAPLAHQFPAWLLSSLQLHFSGLHPFPAILLNSQVSRVEGRPQNRSPWWLSACPTTCFLGLQHHHLAGECI